MNSKKAMVLGAGRGQIPIVELFHKYNYEVTVVSPKGDYPAIEIADDVLYEDIKHKEEILKFAEKNNIQAVLTDQLDESVLTVAYVSENLGLKGIGYDVALNFTNKFVMREKALKCGINVPQYIVAKDKNDIYRKINALKFPLVIKPVDSSASRGVYKVYNIDELLEKFESSQSYSYTSEVIVEEFIEGKEFVIEAFTKDYVPTNLVVGHRDYFDIPDTFIPNATIFVDAISANSDLEERLKSANINLIKSMGLKFGISHAEFMYNEKEDKIYLVEIAARGGGVFISSDLIPAACGVNANELLVREVLGIDINEKIEISQGASAYFCYLTPQGIVNNISNAENIEKIPGVHKAFFDNIEVGMVTKSITDKSSRKGPILVKGKTKKDCYDIIQKVKEQLSITVLSGTEEKNIIWS